MSNPLAALAIQPPNLGSAIQMAEGIRTNRLQQMALERQERRENALEKLFAEDGASVMSGSPEAVAKVWAASPEAGMKLQTYAADQAAKKRATLKDQLEIALKNSDLMIREANMILSAPPAFQPMLYARGVARMKQAGMDVTGVPEQFNPDYVKSVAQQALDVNQRLRTLNVDEVAAAGLPKGTVAQQDGTGKINVVSKPQEFAPPDITRLQAARDALPANDPRRAEIEAAIKKQTALPKGTRVQLADGSTIEVGGVEDGSGLAKPTINKIEEDAFNASTQLSRLDQINRSFRPEFLEILPRGANAWAAAKEKLGANLAPETKKQLEAFTAFRRDTVANVNQTIKDITGAAMSVPEAERIMKQVPTAGTGIFDGDSPTEFQAKLKGATDAARNALLRANWARMKGLNPLKTGVTLEEVPALVERRGAEIEKQVRSANPQADDQAIRQTVRQMLGREFGMTQ